MFDLSDYNYIKLIGVNRNTFPSSTISDMV